MDFSQSDHRQMMANTLGRFFADRYSFAQRMKIAGSDQGWSRDIWAEIADLGIIGALFPSEAGGFGGSGFDIGVIFEAVGQALSVEPFLGTLMGGRILASQGGGQQDLFDKVMAGEQILAFAHEEADSRYDPTRIMAQADYVGGEWKLTGAKVVVPQASTATAFVVSARVCGRGVDGEGDGLSLFLVEAEASGLSCHSYPMIDGGRGADIRFDEVPATLIGEAGSALELIEEAIAAGIVALSWEAVAIMDAVRDETLVYLRTRSQFGVPIGKFQALQHRMATMALEIEQARSAAINAANALEGPRWWRELNASAAKYTIGRVGTLVAEEAIQLHGGIGMTWELPLSHRVKRLTMIGHQLGDEDHHLERFSAIERPATV